MTLALVFGAAALTGVGVLAWWLDRVSMRVTDREIEAARRRQALVGETLSDRVERYTRPPGEAP
jgi:hypothetical protein